TPAAPSSSTDGDDEGAAGVVVADQPGEGEHPREQGVVVVAGFEEALPGEEVGRGGEILRQPAGAAAGFLLEECHEGVFAALPLRLEIGEGNLRFEFALQGEGWSLGAAGHVPQQILVDVADLL